MDDSPRKISRKEFLKETLALGLSGAALTGCSRFSTEVRTESPFDLVVTGGRLIDGTGRPWYKGSIGIRNGRIAAMGEIPDESGAAVIDAADQYVAPGLIDPHAHEEILMLRDPELEKFVRQGVTTIVNGNCGHSVISDDSKKVLEYWWREALIDKRWLNSPLHWSDLRGYADVLRQLGGTTINSVMLLGYGTIRWNVMRGTANRPPDAHEWEQIEASIRSGLEEGAVGLSTGLSYIPCRYAETEELVRVARLLAQGDAIYASHTRFGKQGDPTGGMEAIEIGEKGGCRVQISHFVGRFKGSLDMVTEARNRGLPVTADVIPQSLSHRRRSSRMIEALMVFYPGVFDQSLDELKALLRDPQRRRDIVQKSSFFNNDKSRVVVVKAETDKNREWEGISIDRIAKSLNRDPDDLYVEMVLDEDNPVIFTFDGDVRSLEPNTADLSSRYGEENLLPQGYWTTHPCFGPGSDSIPVDRDDPFGWYEQQRRGAFPGYLRQALNNNVSLEVAIMKASSLPAQQFKIGDRGLLMPGKVADLFIFSPNDYIFPSPAEADPNEPFAMARGVSHVIVNGVPVLTDGQLTGKKPGGLLL